jgi:hypothetical protein
VLAEADLVLLSCDYLFFPVDMHITATTSFAAATCMWRRSIHLHLAGGACSQSGGAGRGSGGGPPAAAAAAAAGGGGRGAGQGGGGRPQGGRTGVRLSRVQGPSRADGTRHTCDLRSASAETSTSHPLSARKAQLSVIDSDCLRNRVQFWLLAVAGQGEGACSGAGAQGAGAAGGASPEGRQVSATRVPLLAARVAQSSSSAALAARLALHLSAHADAQLQMAQGQAGRAG